MQWTGEWLGSWLGDWLGAMGYSPNADQSTGVADPPKQRRNSRLVENRLTSIRAVDTALSILQRAFAEHGKFNRNDPKGSEVWISDPDAAIRQERLGRNLIYVERGTMTPRNLHLAQRAGGSMTGAISYTDAVDCDLFIHCEAGSKLSCEILSSTVYLILKTFRLAVMSEYDLIGIRSTSVSLPTENRDQPGNNWVSTVSVQMAIQEHALMVETANVLNKIRGDATALDPAFPDRG